MYVYVYCMILVYISEKVEMFIKIRIYRVEIIYGVIFGKWLDMFYCNILFFYFYFDFFSMKWIFCFYLYCRYYEFEVIIVEFMKVGWVKIFLDLSLELGLDGNFYVFDGFGVCIWVL